MYLFIVAMETFIRLPVNTSTPLGDTATFNCTADGAVVLTYLVNSTPAAWVAAYGVFISAPLYNGNQISSYLYVPAITSTDNWPVVCIAYLPDETRVDSPPAYLTVTRGDNL